MEKKRIDFSLPSFPTQKILEVKQSYLELYPNRLHCVWEFLYKEPKDDEDLELGWQEDYSDVDLWILKSAIIGFQLSRNSKPTRYKVHIFWGNDGSRIFFKLKSDAEAFMKELMEWWLE